MGSTAARLVRKAGSSVLMVAQSALSPYQRPLVAIDFSDGSRDALEMALRLVDRGRPLIHVVHAYDIEGEASAQKAMRQQEQLRVKLERFVSDSARVPVDWKLVVGRSDPRRIIAETELACRCDPIVLGRYGRSAAAHILIGRVAEAVARSARCDVVVAHPSRRELGR
jgi:nucleotide-binding universal stress UspA family protein